VGSSALDRLQLRSQPEPEAPAASTSASFPDCWTAYGATNAELETYGATPALTTGHAWLVLAVDVALLVLLALAVFVAVGSPLLRLVSLALAVMVLLSAAAALVWLASTATQIQPRVRVLRIRSALGSGTEIPWDRIAEISLVARRGRPAIGLRLRSPAPEHSGRASAGGLRRRLTSGFDWLLVPRDGNAELLGRVLLRYCIDPRQRRRHLPEG
jgi:hypothetical protein